MNPTPQPNHPQEPLRPFSQATGFIFQSAGFLLASATCCWWSLSGRFGGMLRPEDPLDMRTRWLSLASAADIWEMLGVCILFVGGLGLVAAGISLQHGMARRARGITWSCGAVAAFYGCYAGAACVWFPAVGSILVPASLGAVWTVFFLLAGASGEELARVPATDRDSSWSQSDEDDLRRTLSPRGPDETSP